MGSALTAAGSAPQRRRLLLSVVGLLLAHAAVAAPPLLRSPGLHLLNLDAGVARWIGPGGHPAWAPDGRTVYVEAHHEVFDAAPLGPIYALNVDTGAAQSLAQSSPMGCARVSPDGRQVAELSEQPGGAVMAVLETNGYPASPGATLGRLTPASRDAFAWLRPLTLVFAGDGAGGPAGVYVLPLHTGPPTLIAEVAGADGVWPSPDGQLVAVRAAGRLSVVPVAGGAAKAICDGPAPITAVAWDADGQGLSVVTGEREATLEHRGLDGQVRGTCRLPGQLESRVGFAGDRVVYLAVDAGRPQVLSVPRTGGDATVLATIDPAVPLRPHPAWPAPAPALSPDGKRLILALGRTDRWGLTDRDKLETTDTNDAGRTVRVIRRLRDVGSSGVVFQPRDLRFGGRERPQADGGVADDTRPGTFRWSRPSPPRWVVLHHTSTQSDRGSLNALTGERNGLLAQLYEDMTPNAWLGAEPNTIGVHYLVLRAGTVLQLVEEKYLARHAGSGQWRNTGPIYDFNAETIGIEIVANGYDFTGGQVEHVGRLVADICRRQAIPLRHVVDESFTEGVLYHKDFAGGLRGKPDPAGWPWERMREAAERYLSGG